jgi:UDP-N-acetylmuramate dehydrogenase
VTALDELAERLGSLAQREAALGARTTYRVGGAADVLVEVHDLGALEAVARALEGTEVEVLVVGRGSNLLVADAGFHGLALVLAGVFESLDDPRDEGADVIVRAGGAVALPVLARRLADQGIVGLEWAVGVPGSVGGAVRMNAGGHGAEVSERLVGAELFDLRAGRALTRDASGLELAYRHSNVASCEVVTAASFRLARGDAAAAKARVAEIVRWRREHQPGGSNAGSVFTNPPGDHAGRLVEAAGAKGRRHGSAHVSDKHANFIQADPGGRADDVYALIDEVRDLVADELGVELRTELVTVGFEAAP